LIFPGLSHFDNFGQFWLFARQNGKTWGMQEILFQLKKDGDGAFLG
jgi:hypothetical protein